MVQEQSVEVDVGGMTEGQVHVSQRQEQAVDQRHEERREVFVIAGLAGSGKSTVAEMIAEQHDEAVEVHEMSDHVRQSWRNNTHVDEYEGEDINDNELGEWAAEQKDEHGNGYFARSLAAYLNTPQTPHVVISGVRSPAEAQAIRNEFEAADVTAVAVWTLPDIRFNRKYGSDAMTDPEAVEEFNERNERELWDWGAVAFFSSSSTNEADYIIPNHDDFETLRDHVRQLLNGYGVYGENPFPHDDFERVAQYL